MSGGGQVCTEPPLQYLQKGGKKRKNKTKRRGMKGGGFWDTLGLKPFWSPSNPGAVGYDKGISHIFMSLSPTWCSLYSGNLF